MPRGSPRVTRRHAKAHHDDSDDNDDLNDSHNRSYASTQSRHNDSRYSSSSFHRSRNDSNSFDLDADKTASHHSSLHSNSPQSKSDTSYDSFSTSGIYPNLSEEVNESGDSSFTGINDSKKGRRLYPKVESPSDWKTRQPPASSPYGKRPSSQNLESDNSSNTFKGVLCLCVILIVVVLILLVKPDSTTSSSTTSSAEVKSGYERFEEYITTLKSSFPSQTARFWLTVSASAQHVFTQQDPCYPSVILMATHNKNRKLNTCLAKKIASVFSASYGLNSDSSEITTDVEDYNYMDSDEQKLTLDKAMQTAFQEGGQKAFVINNVHSLSPKAALLLHGFCDGDNAPYKDVMIILTFQVDDDTVFRSVKEVEGFLTDIWSSGLDMDKLSALMSRIANNPIVVMKEDETTVNKFCS